MNLINNRLYIGHTLYSYIISGIHNTNITNLGSKVITDKHWTKRIRFDWNMCLAD